MIEKLFIKPIKGNDPVCVKSIELTEGKGVEGDCHADGGDRAVCLVTKYTDDRLNGIREKYNCMAKFSPNIVIETDKIFSAGDRISVNTAEIRVTSVGRECHHLCDLPDCPLISGIVFASVLRSGTINIGDTEEYD